MHVRIALITPVHDRADFLRAALESARAQAYSGLDLIVIDAASTDGSAGVARGLGATVVSEPDSGMYEALNKGLVLARGAEIIGFLNSDDLLRPGALAAVAEAASKHPDADMFCGTAVATRDGRLERDYGDPADQDLSWSALLFGNPLFNARFFRRRCFDRIGGFDPALRIAGDRDFLIRAKLAGLLTLAIDTLLYEYRIHAGSLTFRPEPGVGRAGRQEYLQLAQHYAGPAFPPDLRMAARRWAARQAAWLIADGFRTGSRAGSLTALSLTRQMPHWPLLAAVEAGRRMLSKGGF